jgi:2,4-dienoyl-CoA reductase-like NADH-dependent reductase (Old Yellow Enzyme family)
MTAPDAFDPMTLTHGPSWSHRLALAPLTNQQSHDDGCVSADDLSWMRMVAEGGYSFIITCAANVQANGKAFRRQLGVYDDRHIDGLIQIADIIRAGGAVSAVQIHHAGHQGLGGASGEPYAMSPTDGVREMTLGEVEALRDDFIAAALRARAAGFDGVEVHGAFGYVLSASLSPTLNTRTDRYGGSIEGRSRLLFEVLEGIRAEADADLQLGLRLTLNGYGLRLAEMQEIVQEILHRDLIDYLDLCPRSALQLSKDPDFQGRTTIGAITELDRGRTRIGASGRVLHGEHIEAVLAADCDFVMLGEAALLEPHFPHLIKADRAHRGPERPVTAETLRAVGLSDNFIEYIGIETPELFLPREPHA